MAFTWVTVRFCGIWRTGQRDARCPPPSSLSRRILSPSLTLGQLRSCSLRVTSGSLPQRSGSDAVISPAGTLSVPPKMSFAYHTGPGMSRILSLSPPHFVAKSAVKTLSAGTVPFLISGSSRLAIRVQWMSPELIRTVFVAITCEIGHLSAQR